MCLAWTIHRNINSPSWMFPLASYPPYGVSLTIEEKFIGEKQQPGITINQIRKSHSGTTNPPIDPRNHRLCWGSAASPMRTGHGWSTLVLYCRPRGRPESKRILQFQLEGGFKRMTLAGLSQIQVSTWYPLLYPFLRTSGLPGKETSRALWRWGALGEVKRECS